MDSFRMAISLVVILLLFVGGSFLWSSYISSTGIHSSEILQKFNTQDEFLNFVKQSSELTGGSSFSNFGGIGISSDARAVGAPVANIKESGDSKVASDYSQTNVQVEGIDELDTVKNDGEYIYTVNGRNLSIVKAFPADSLSIVSSISLEHAINGIFVSGNNLIIVEPTYSYQYGIAEGAVVKVRSEIGIIAPSRSTSEVDVHVYDITDKTNPILKKTYGIDGNYYAARLNGNNLYIISNEYLDTQQISLPEFRADGEVKSIAITDVYRPSVAVNNLFFTSVLAVDIETLDYKGDVFLTGGYGSFYMSEKSIYMTSQKSYDYNNLQEEITRSVFLELLPTEVRSNIESIIDNSNLNQNEKSVKISNIFEKYFNSLDVTQKQDFQVRLQNATQQAYTSIAQKYERTVIHRIDVSGLELTYAGSGEVSGYLLNQFSLDEHNDNLRLATTTGQIGGGVTTNNVYILDKNFNVIGTLEGLAEGERIYSSRFVNDKVYLVTFRQVDPLFVIDLTTPENPTVLGYLKVPGFSSYLQPIGNNLLMGIGQDATNEGRVQGVKVSLFDVSDFTNPKELSTYVVRGTWSSTEAEYEHKAVLFDDEKDLLVIPVTYYDGQNGEPYAHYWQGAFVFKVTDSLIELRGKITHEQKVDTETGKRYPWWNGQSYVRRSLFMEDVIYTVSDKLVQANDLTTLDEISKVKLPVDNYYSGPIAY